MNTEVTLADYSKEETLAHGRFAIGRGLFARTVYESSVIFAYIQISFPPHVSAIRFGSPRNKYVSLIVLSRPIDQETTIPEGSKGRKMGGGDRRQKILVTAL